MRIEWTERYLSELEVIGDYIAEHNPRAAVRVVGDIHGKTGKLLSANPVIGRRGEIRGTRALVIPGTPTSLPTASPTRISKCRSSSTARVNGPTRFDGGILPGLPSPKSGPPGP